MELRASMIAAALAALAACGGPKKVARPAVSDDPVIGLGQLKDEMCACEDQGCAQEVSDRLSAFAEKHAADQVSEDEGQQIDALNGELAACIDRLAEQSDERMSPTDN